MVIKWSLNGHLLVNYLENITKFVLQYIVFVVLCFVLSTQYLLEDSYGENNRVEQLKDHR